MLNELILLAVYVMMLQLGSPNYHVREQTTQYLISKPETKIVLERLRHSRDLEIARRVVIIVDAQQAIYAREASKRLLDKYGRPWLDLNDLNLTEEDVEKLGFGHVMFAYTYFVEQVRPNFPKNGFPQFPEFSAATSLFVECALRKGWSETRVIDALRIMAIREAEYKARLKSAYPNAYP